MRAVLSLLIGTALLLCGSGLLTTTLGIQLARGGQSLGVAGLVASSLSLGLVLGSLRATRFIARVGHIRAFSGFSGILGASTIAISLVPEPLALMALRVLQGFVLGGSYLVIESWLGASATPSTRGRILGVYIMTCQVALAVGQLLVTSSKNGDALSLAAMLFILALVPVVWTRQREPQLPEVGRIGFRDMTRRAPVAAFGCLVAGLTIGSLLHLGAAYATALGASVGRVAAFIASAVLGGLILQWPIGHVADRVDRRLVIELIALSTAACALCLLVTGQSLTPSAGALAFTASAFALGAACFVLYPVSVAHAHDRVSPPEAVAASATMVLAYGVGSAVGPLCLSGALEIWGPHALPIGIFAFNLFLGGLACVRLVRHLRVHEVWRAPYRPIALPQVVPAELAVRAAAPSEAGRAPQSSES